MNTPAATKAIVVEQMEVAHDAAWKAIYGPGADAHLNPEGYDFACKVADAVLAATSRLAASAHDGSGRVKSLPSHQREGVRPAYSQAMVDLLDAYEQRIWVWAQGCEIDGIQQRSARGDSYNESRRDDAAKARSDLIRQIDALTWQDPTPAAVPVSADQPETP